MTEPKQLRELRHSMIHMTERDRARRKETERKRERRGEQLVHAAALSFLK